MPELLTIREASHWASQHLSKKVTPSNISYLIQYGRVQKRRENGNTLVRRSDLEEYYAANYFPKAEKWKDELGEGLNWALSFAEYRESETTKHVHRLHPYKGKFIPQLVEYFLDDHVDEFKREVFFKRGDVVLDPFCGSGTTLVQACELGMHSIGVDISEFNSHISNSKVGSYDLSSIQVAASDITVRLREFQSSKTNAEFEKRLLEELGGFNNEYFPSPEFKRQVQSGQIDEKLYGREKEKEFIVRYSQLVNSYKIRLTQRRNDTFLDKWYLCCVRAEIDFVFKQIEAVADSATKSILRMVLSRTIRSCRATTHSDLGTLINPVTTTYYCKKHGKICKPLFSILSWWERYTKDTIKRLEHFDRLRKDVHSICLTGDSRTVDIPIELDQANNAFAQLVRSKKIRGIFSSPPYVGLIDYHEQHAYAYDLFGFARNDEAEIGPLFRGQGKDARKSYVAGISSVLKNCKRFLRKDYDVFLVANDKYGLYPDIASSSGMRIVNRYNRPVLNRVEKDRAAYSETVFHMKAD